MNNLVTNLFPKPTPSSEMGLLLPLRNVVLLPDITLPVVAGRSRSMAVAAATLETTDRELVIATVCPEPAQRLQEDETTEIEHLDELYPVATLAVVQRMLRLPMGPMQLVVQGQERVRLQRLSSVSPTYMVEFQRLPNLTVDAAVAEGTDAKLLDALTGALKSLWREAADLNPNFPDELLALLLESDEPAQLVYQTALLLNQDVPQMQALLEQENLEHLLRQILADLHRELEVRRLRKEILGKTQQELDQQQREFILRQQLKHIQEELGEIDPDSKETEDLRQQLVAAALPLAAEKQAKRGIGAAGAHRQCLR